MKKIFIFLFTSVFIISSYSQKIPIVFDENFDNNALNWYLGDAEDASSEISSGYFYIYNKQTNYDYRFWNSFDFDSKKDFVVESKIRQVYGETDHGYGLMIASDGVDENYNFEITSQGYYRTSNKSDGSYDDNDWKKTQYINAKGKYNVLKIKKSRGYLYYYINGNLVNTQKFGRVFGKDYGFVLRGKTKAQVDYLKISGVTPKINVVKNPINNPKENIGTTINTKYTELMPIISADGKTLYFIRDNYPGNIGSDKDHNDVWYSINRNGQWSTAKNIGKPLNNLGHNFVVFVTPDNNTLILNGTYTAWGEDAGNGISISKKNSDGSWSIPKEIKIDDFYNDDKYQNFTFSPDLQVMVMGIMRNNDTYGESDLYVSFRKSDGSYTAPKNMGVNVNTSGEEGTPFVASDGKTLYFYSDGLAGYGDADIFVTKRLDNSWQKWSTPLNMGSNINTSGWDAYFALDAKGDYAYLVSSHNSIGNEDIYRVKIQEELQPDPVVLISGRVFDSKTKKPLSAKILYDDLSINKEVGVANSNGQTGEYKIVLPYGKKYGFFAKKTGYMALSDNIDLTNVQQYQEITRDLYLAPIEVDEQIVLNNLFFQTGKSILLPSSYPELDRLKIVLDENADIKIEIHGHTNNIGNIQKLIELSEQRAEAVKKYLVSKGVSPDRISTKGYGPNKPIASNDTKSGRIKNQRVEFKIIKK